MVRCVAAAATVGAIARDIRWATDRAATIGRARGEEATAIGISVVNRISMRGGAQASSCVAIWRGID